MLLALTSTAIGVVIGLLLAVLGVSRNRFLRLISRVYTDVLRGLPAILTILLVGLAWQGPCAHLPAVTPTSSRSWR